MTIKAIETRYKGYRFRSRLEARWAVYFDAMGIEWQYELEGFAFDYLQDGKKVTVAYLPDFYLPQFNFYAEIKGVVPPKSEILKMISFCAALNKGILCLIDTPSQGTCGICYWPVVRNGEDGLLTTLGVRFLKLDAATAIELFYAGEKFPGAWIPLVDNLYTEANGKYLTDVQSMILLDNGEIRSFTVTEDTVWNARELSPLSAINAALSARFEHGESGA